MYDSNENLSKVPFNDSRPNLEVGSPGSRSILQDQTYHGDLCATVDNDLYHKYRSTSIL